MRVLIADPDLERASALSEALVSRGHRVEHAAHGAAALELALEALPDAVVAPIDLPVIDGARLAEILRGNPRLRHASFVFLVKDELDAPLAMDPRDSVAVAPWKVDDVLACVGEIVERIARYGDDRASADIEGRLEQIALADLLQVLHLNRRSGTLRIWRHGGMGSGSIAVRAGQLCDAHVPLADGSALLGEKALFRLLAWRSGRFEFSPGAATLERRIRRPTRALLVEGARQVHEWETLSRELPIREMRLVVRVAREQIPPTAHPLMREVIDAALAYRELGAVLDHTSFPDAQVLRVISDLLGRGALAPEEPRGGERGGAVLATFTPAQHRRLRDWAAAQRPRPGPVLKVPLLAGDPAVMRAVLAALRECTDFQTETRLVRDPEQVARPGTLGHFPLGHGLALRVVGLVASPPHATLVPVVAHGMLGAIAAARVAPGGDAEPGSAALAMAEGLRQQGAPRVLTLLVEDPDAAAQPGAPDRARPPAAADPSRLPCARPEERARALRELCARLVP
jgi:CheY-like chemotaxis protein